MGLRINSTDPFRVKKLPKWHPRRVLKTLVTWLRDYEARWNYEAYQLPSQSLGSLPDVPDFDQNDTAVTPTQMRYLIEVCCQCVEQHEEGKFVEIGCYRGVTTKILAQVVSPREYIAVDPYMGWGGAERDLEIFERRTMGLGNVFHKRETSGEAARSWEKGSISFAFIDAVHDYWNTSYDIEVWSNYLRPGGYLAAHDTDTKMFAGTRRAVYEKKGGGFSVFAHIPDLTILRKE
jgi:predicted O-methyltransferase YrrM